MQYGKICATTFLSIFMGACSVLNNGLSNSAQNNDSRNVANVQKNGNRVPNPDFDRNASADSQSRKVQSLNDNVSSDPVVLSWAFYLGFRQTYIDALEDRPQTPEQINKALNYLKDFIEAEGAKIYLDKKSQEILIQALIDEADKGYDKNQSFSLDDVDRAFYKTMIVVGKTNAITSPRYADKVSEWMEKDKKNELNIFVVSAISRLAENVEISQQEAASEFRRQNSPAPSPAQ